MYLTEIFGTLIRIAQNAATYPGLKCRVRACDTQVSTRSMTDVHGSGLNVRKKIAIRFNVSCISTAIRCHLLMRMASLDVSESRVRVRMSGSWIA